LAAASTEDEEAAAESIIRWLGSSQDWLLILGNADEPGIARAPERTYVATQNYVLLSSLQ
jgi:hypothetical protein